ncbi:ChbG/HpnK family deacetylase [uncultured Roseobacter sp.]|uniref:ChbG/HpnK family deacetylase n=1 Tax=uncultured Roseobacter sp. TaxID=114847 RepID=UPI00260C189F|nr:ChbG/HpnK family deacetylase [uncultured Roseobacter sp.]
MSSSIRLLVRADDAGSSWASNEGCLRACREGIARSVEVMMPGAWVAHAAQLFNQHRDIDIGIHLTLTSEWDNVKWRPLTQANSLVDQSGNFLPLLLPRPDDDRPCLLESAWLFDEIVDEFRAQIELGLKLFPQATHISSHMLSHFSDFDPRVGEMVAELCEDYGLIDDPLGRGLTRIKGYPDFPRDTKLRTTAFIKQLEALSPGTYIFIDHPAVDTAELMATGHRGYEDVHEDRVTCLETLTDPELKRQIDQMDIKLVGYKDL